MVEPTEVGAARPGELDDQHEALVALLASRYAAAPWGESPEELEAEARHLAAEVGRPGVRTVLARRGSVVVGLAQTGWGRTVLDDLATAWRGRDLGGWGPTVIELRQLLVAPAVAGEGLGSRLHDAVIDVSDGPALLLTHPAASEALSLYERRGWRRLARLEVAPGHPRLVLGLGTP